MFQPDDDFERLGPRQDCLGGLLEIDWDADGPGAVISNRRSSPDTQELTTGAQCRRCSTWECSTILATPVTALLPHCRKTLWEAEGKDSSVEDATVNFSCNVLFLDARINFKYFYDRSYRGQWRIGNR